MIKVKALFLLLVSAFLSVGSASAQYLQQGMRLIEIAPQKRVWMTRPQIDQLVAYNHKVRRICGGFFDVTEDPYSQQQPLQLLRDFSSAEPTQQSIVNHLLPKATAGALWNKVRQIESMGERNAETMNGERAALWIRDEFIRIAGRRLTTDTRVVLFPHRRFRQPSVIAQIAGTGPSASERIVIGAHLDSVGGPGADDDASGVTTVLEIFRILMESGFRPNRTIEFMGYAGEELGLIGSQDIAKNYRNARIPVFGVLHFDMTMYSDPNKSITLISDNVDRGLSVFVGKLVQVYLNKRARFESCDYACSDHASWNRNGFPSVYPFEGEFKYSNPYIHSPEDASNKLDPTHGVQFVQLGLSYAIEMAQMQ